MKHLVFCVVIIGLFVGCYDKPHDTSIENLHTKSHKVLTANGVVTVPEPTALLTRAKIMAILFGRWGQKPFIHNDLEGRMYMDNQYMDNHRWGSGNADGCIIVKDNGVVILKIKEPWGARRSRTTLYDSAYSDRLDVYMIALKVAIDAQAEALRQSQAAAELQRVFEETRF